MSERVSDRGSQKAGERPLHIELLSLWFSCPRIPSRISRGRQSFRSGIALGQHDLLHPPSRFPWDRQVDGSAEEGLYRLSSFQRARGHGDAEKGLGRLRSPQKAGGQRPWRRGGGVHEVLLKGPEAMAVDSWTEKFE